ncbi:hypothetical protein OESDEN_02031 [Oesophagostomum dentatum]|uniref:Uncharacterized protein n=1 Tax=Oesophagostomum dentatum TaxID=61180 RepID=A0A0B1TRH4_OESDE|nr:hypothetical protein OESDEN_02031 [Oesophagostomum dentatum]
MLITYGYIFYTLRKRLRAIQLQEMAGGQFLGFGADVGNITTSAIQSVIGIAPKNRNMITWEKPLLRKIEETAAEHASSLNDSEREQLQTILEAVHPSSSGSQENTTIEDEKTIVPLLCCLKPSHSNARILIMGRCWNYLDLHTRKIICLDAFPMLSTPFLFAVERSQSASELRRIGVVTRKFQQHLMKTVEARASSHRWSVFVV